MSAADVQTARALGRTAYAEGRMRAPDAATLALVGNVPVGLQRTIDLMHAFTAGYDEAATAAANAALADTEAAANAVHRASALVEHYDEMLDLGCGPDVQLASAIADLLHKADADGHGAANVLDLAKYHYAGLDGATGLDTVSTP